jgi:hypothetical protein
MEGFGEDDQVITQTEEWDLPENFIEFGQRVESVGLAADEERKRQAEIFNPFAHDMLGTTSAEASRIGSGSDDEGQHVNPDESTDTVVVNAGDPVSDTSIPFPTRQATWKEQVEAQERVRAAEAAIAWMTDAERHMLTIENMEPLPWEGFSDKVYRRGETQFQAIEQRYFEEGSVAPDPGFDIMGGGRFRLPSRVKL